MTNNLIAHLSAVLACPIKNITSISGGDISKAYCLQTTTERFFCKTNTSSDAENMFALEKAGLQTIGATNTIHVPLVYGNGKIDNTAFLLLQYIENQQPNNSAFKRFGNALAQLHKVSAENFGWDSNNYIGSLPQSNIKNTKWSNFYVQERLWPQLKHAEENGLLASSEVPSIYTMLQVCTPWLETVRPSLIHGDLWSGNFLISSNGTPYLIDPAVYFGDRRVDMAMTRLFGGFAPEFYQAYDSHFSEKNREQTYDELYQLYYLLVHLNLFGRSYYPAVQKILKRYF